MSKLWAFCQEGLLKDGPSLQFERTRCHHHTQVVTHSVWMVSKDGHNKLDHHQRTTDSLSGQIGTKCPKKHSKCSARWIYKSPTYLGLTQGSCCQNQKRSSSPAKKKARHFSGFHEISWDILVVEHAPPFQVSSEYPNLIPLQHHHIGIYPQMLPLHSECQSKPPLAQHPRIQLIISVGFDAKIITIGTMGRNHLASWKNTFSS